MADNETWLDEIVTLTEGAALRGISIDTLRNEAKKGRVKILILSKRRRGITRREALKGRQEDDSETDWRRPPVKTFPEKIWRKDRYDLYRHFDANGVLLYVGCSKSALMRFLRDHHRDSFWVYSVARIEITPFNTLEEAQAAEQAAIRDEQPKFNRQGSAR